jgi:hypothetical protein
MLPLFSAGMPDGDGRAPFLASACVSKGECGGCDTSSLWMLCGRSTSVPRTDNGEFSLRFIGTRPAWGRPMAAAAATAAGLIGDGVLDGECAPASGARFASGVKADATAAAVGEFCRLAKSDSELRRFFRCCCCFDPRGRRGVSSMLAVGTTDVGVTGTCELCGRDGLSGMKKPPSTLIWSRDTGRDDDADADDDDDCGGGGG